MSTPLAHNALFILATVKVLYGLREIEVIGNDVSINDLALKIVKECVALYNYPDACQAVRRPDGTILTRRVTHFEMPKESGMEPNWHKLLTPEFISRVQDTDTVSEDSFHDTADQDGDIMGQYTDFYAWRQAKEEYMLWAANNGNDKAMLLAEMLGAHLEIADWFNDQMFRMYVTMQKDGRIKIGHAEFGPDEKREAFGLFKSLIMSLQEQAAVIKVGSIFENVSALNDAIKASYWETYSPWLANNSLKFVKPVSYDELFEPSDQQLRLLEKAGISYEALESDTDWFIEVCSTQTGAYILEALDFIHSLRQEIIR